MVKTAPQQLNLGVSLKDEATFKNFYVAGEKNAVAMDAMRAFAVTPPFSSKGTDIIVASNIVAWGAPGSGLTHILQAVCHQASLSGRKAQYIPMLDVIGFSAQDICEGLESAEIVCLDGIDHICGNRQWEVALFNLYNNLKDRGHALLLSSHTSPPSLPILLPDLKSRVLGSVVYHIQRLNDVDKQAALIKRAAARGIDMPEDVVKFILTRAPRDMNELFYLLNRLDEASLQRQRRLTIPFVKETLGI